MDSIESVEWVEVTQIASTVTTFVTFQGVSFLQQAQAVVVAKIMPTQNMGFEEFGMVGMRIALFDGVNEKISVEGSDNMKTLYLLTRRMQLESWDNPMTAINVWHWVKAINNYCIKNRIAINSIPVEGLR